MKKTIFSSTRNEGLSLIELMVAMAILVFGAIAGLSIMLQAHKANDLSRAKTMAINAAEQQIESVFRDAPSNVDAYNNITFPIGDLVRPGGGNAGLITVTATQPAAVTVNVAWQGQGILPQGQVTLTALRDRATR